MERHDNTPNTFNEASGASETRETSGANGKAEWPNHPMAKSEIFTHVTPDGYRNKVEDFVATGRFMGRVGKEEHLEHLLKFEAGRKGEHEKEKAEYSHRLKNVLAKTPEERAKAVKDIKHNHELANRSILDKYSNKAKEYYKDNNMGIAKEFNSRSKEDKDIDMER